MKYPTIKDRRLVAKRYFEEVRVLDIANEIGYHPATIYEELRPEYDPLLTQRTVQATIRRRGNRKPPTATLRDC